MMDIFFTDPNDVPVPPEEVKIRELQAKPYSDGRRVGVRFHITPFLKRPNVEIAIHNQEGQEVANLNVVEVIENQMTFTMHMQGAFPSGRHTLTMRLFYANLEELENGEEEPIDLTKALEEAAQVIDTAELTFDVAAPDA